ncbi:hypothetical protein J1N35_023645 [Gossypium stocksii]|uniref:Uncharacterized protein n=1 Tax=Gossypium stocksii TaxID=47602 RepID=A0A9D3VKM4_9ROSI|nr:hypothetical protein J1N35_023645 [Gossypium stocksii]
MMWLRELDLSGTALKELPSSIDNLIGLVKLSLNNCENLVCLPHSFYKLKYLDFISLQNCSRLETFPEILETMEKLRVLDLSGTALKELPYSIDNLIGLKYLSLISCENLVCLPHNLYKLKSLLHFSTCGDSNLAVENMFTAIGGQPEKQKHLHGLSLLWRLDLSESNLENLPTTIKQFPCLEELILRKCKGLKSLPELPPSLVYLDAHDCTSLEDVSSIKKVFEQALFCEDGLNRWLKLIFTECFQLNEKCTGNDTSVEEVSSIKKLSKQAVFCKSLGWLFTNCFQLDQKAVSSAETPKLEMPFEQLVTVLKDYHQAPPESKKGTRIVTCVPGGEIPEWFDFKSLGTSLNIQLPSEWCSNNSRINFPCFVASVVVSFPDSYIGMEFGIRCKCHLKSCNGDSHYLSCYVSGGFESRLSDHLFLLYGGEEVWGFVKSEASNKRFYNEASFSFYLDIDKRILSECKRKSQALRNSLSRHCFVRKNNIDPSFGYLPIDSYWIKKLSAILEHQSCRCFLGIHQGCSQRNEVIACVPGSEIPEWIDFKSLRSSITIQLPSEWYCYGQKKIPGLLFHSKTILIYEISL